MGACYVDGLDTVDSYSQDSDRAARTQHRDFVIPVSRFTQYLIGVLAQHRRRAWRLYRCDRQLDRTTHQRQRAGMRMGSVDDHAARTHLRIGEHLG